MRAQETALRFALALACALAASGARSEEIAVIVHPERTARLDAEALASIYLKQRRHWQDGTRIVPVNHDASSALRDAFTRAVLALSPEQLGRYWNRLYFEGVLPPATLASDEAVLRFVAGERRAIGYVRASTVNEGVRVVLRLQSEAPAPRP
jgi:ABC-type phosphate transport system substrate-binding protein